MEWQPIETAPKYKEVLVWRADAGVMMGQISTLSEVLTDSEIEQSKLSEDELHSDNWFIGSSMCSELAEGDEIPTHWLPLPKEPK